MAQLDTLLQKDDAVQAEMFVEPSKEAWCLVRHLGPLVAPPDAKPTWVNRTIGVLVVAPFTQFTLLSFDLQAFLFRVFHTTIWARLGHVLFMPVVNFFMMVALSQFRLGGTPSSHGWSGPSINGGMIYAAVLLVWYLAAALSTRMIGWWLVVVPMVVAMALGADAYYCHTFTLAPALRHWYAPTPLVWNPWLWMAAGAFMIAVSHAPEPRLPPRVGSSRRWLSVRESIFGTPDAPNSPTLRVIRALQFMTQFITGPLNEWWASPRLMPYNVLMVMLSLGYKPAIAEKLNEYVERSLASGNPAVDYVGIGGGTFLTPVAPPR